MGFIDVLSQLSWLQNVRAMRTIFRIIGPGKFTMALICEFYI